MEGGGGVPHFWAASLAPGKEQTFSLTGTEIHLTQACIAGKGNAVVHVKTERIDEFFPVCHLNEKTKSSCLLDLNLFPTDVQVAFKAVGNAPVSLLGECPTAPLYFVTSKILISSSRYRILRCGHV